MQSYRYQEGSLHRLIQANPSTPAVIQVRPKGFKAILESTIDFLETYQLPATLLAKLPKGSLWEEDLWRYAQRMGEQGRLYRFVRTSSETPAPYGTAIVPLPASHTWPGEYFLVILSPTFCTLMVAHRVRSTAAVFLPEPGEESIEGIEGPGGGASQPQVGTVLYLEIYSSVQPALLRELLGAIRPVVAQAAQQVHTSGADPSALQDLLTHWETYCGVPPSLDDTSPLLDKWLGWQLRQQEHLRQMGAAYRKQAMTASNLSSQNEVLLNTLRIKDDFLNTVGQELRTPLSTIKTALTLLSSPNLKPPQRQRYMDMISHECDRQRALISGVLDLLQMETSLGQMRPEPVQLVDVVPPVVSTYQPLAQEKGIMVAYTIPDNLPPVACLESWLRPIVIHLLNNSLKYTEAGGKVWVTAHPQEDAVELEIRDTGVGISPTELPNIFDHFYRGRNLPSGETEGAGLGLSIVQQLLMYCGGSIVVNSQPGTGTTFRVKLPLYQG